MTVPDAAPYLSADPAAVADWLANEGVELNGRLDVRRIGIGQSNITSAVTDESGRSWILREPPVGASGTAHDMRREIMMLDALSQTDVPVPEVIARGEYPDGRTFYAMTRVGGVVLESEADAGRLTEAQRRSVGQEAVTILGRLHTISPESVGLDHLQSVTPYVTRQIRRSVQMWERVGVGTTHEDLWGRLVRRLCDVPLPTTRNSIVHGDYRLSNLLVDDGAVSGVLDWELATVGDPIVDLAWLLDDWRGPDDPAIAMPSPTRVGGFGTTDDVVTTYTTVTGVDPTASGRLDYYRALTHWRAATLIQGVIARRRSGAMGDHGAIPLDALDDTVAYLLGAARDHIDRSEHEA
ncbi:phosphotransferase family protein [Gordonia polyisoprenivorans]|uniref:phosphotransferase family protein n=1 Tax=Gordonia polyisoprenivorans TaxID=84595 RepID=UPI001FCAC81C|nr:phosphotransferase family protein [Gordonia polyisoprenivorans]